ncbi:MAG: serine/threonine protein kinase [Deltaproteobacteria bacterium]|nr:serine/threonine protein kinase [Deltaproteobacteria bacterium]
MNVGDTIGEYQIVSRIRAGGMATLYLGRRSGLAGFEREVALKVVHPHLAAEPRYVEMFLDEARLAARIDHPNVVHIHDMGEAAGTLYLVMEYVQGCSLWQLSRAMDKQQRRMGVDLATHIAIEVAEGLHAAHETCGPDGASLEVVHRDVSPQNVLLAFKGHLKLIDFGIAKARGRLQETVGGNLKGKLRYMAPEQALGRPVDRRTDVYALGIVLWELLAGRRFHTVETEMALLEQIRSPSTKPPSTYNEAVPQSLDRAVMDALAPDPEQRLPTAHAFRMRLAQAYPAALAVDASRVAALLTSVMAGMSAGPRGAAAQGASSARVSAPTPVMGTAAQPPDAAGASGADAGADGGALPLPLLPTFPGNLEDGPDPNDPFNGTTDKDPVGLDADSHPSPVAPPVAMDVELVRKPTLVLPAQQKRRSVLPWALGGALTLILCGGAAALGARAFYLTARSGSAAQTPQAPSPVVLTTPVVVTVPVAQAEPPPSAPVAPPEVQDAADASVVVAPVAPVAPESTDASVVAAPVVAAPEGAPPVVAQRTDAPARRPPAPANPRGPARAVPVSTQSARDPGPVAVPVALPRVPGVTGAGGSAQPPAAPEVPGAPRVPRAPTPQGIQPTFVEEPNF